MPNVDILPKLCKVISVVYFICWSGPVLSDEYVTLIDPVFMKYDRGFFLNTWSPAEFDGVEYAGDFYPLVQINREVIRTKIGTWCRVYLLDIAPLALFRDKNGNFEVYNHDREDYLKFTCD